MSWRFRSGFPAMLLILIALPACRLTDVQLWRPQEAPGAALCEVEEVRDIVYCAGDPADNDRHRLDLFVPKGLNDFPVVILVHGGAWVMGDNRCCGLYSSVGEFLAGRGIGAVLPNYRLSPGVQHPEQVKDMAKAFAWTSRHIAEYGGRPDQLFLVGHSAGGHLVSLLATDEQYLKAEGLGSADIKGVVGISGVYSIPPGKVAVTLGGPPPADFRLDEMIPIRDTLATPVKRTGLPGIPLNLDVYGRTFTDDPEVRADASPVNHVRPGLPPFLLINAENDLPTLSGMTEEFHQALEGQGCTVQALRVPGRNHNSIMYGAVRVDDPVAHAMLDFIGRLVAVQP